MHRHAFSIAVFLFAVGGIVAPAPPPPVIAARIQDVLAAPFPDMADAMRFVADTGDASLAQ